MEEGRRFGWRYAHAHAAKVVAAKSAAAESASIATKAASAKVVTVLSSEVVTLAAPTTVLLPHCSSDAGSPKSEVHLNFSTRDGR